MFPSDQLNDLQIDLGRSLLQYVGESWPWTGEDETSERTVLERIIAEQKATVLQFATLLDERKHRIAYGQYPSDYTSLHYVALDYLLAQLVGQQRDLAADLSAAVDDAAGDNEAQSLLKAAAEQAGRHADELAALAAGRKSRSTVVG
ncbi:MAG: hypothetical protein JNG89_16480 [Planctomycetaceae bacterium]|nr:hypothetical protein [Planctomycetaceae bacterium]